MAVPGGLAALHSRGPDSIAFTPPVHMAVLLLTPQPGRETALGSDRLQRFTARSGTLEIMPAGVDVRARWPVSKQNILFAMDSTRLAYLADKEFGRSFSELQPPKAGTVDPYAASIGQLLRKEFLAEGGPSTLLVDSLHTIFSLHLLRRYAHKRGGRQPVQRGGLSPVARRAVLALMHDHLADPVPLAALAAAARLSPGYFLRAFRESFGQPPHRHFLQLRMEHAEKLIRETDLPFADIARTAGFSSQSHMTSTLARLRLATPGQLRRSEHQADPGRPMPAPRLAAACADPAA
ncbi:MAG TPA: AraC family transcriptional regulator [Roseomonas sp.]|jgi:AraC family transcriptional regulator